MTLDEAIKHCLEQAEENDNCADKCEAVYGEDNGIIEACRECANDHRQLAEWLRELKERREADVQNEVLQYLFNKEREAESMPYSDVRQERIVTLREVIRYVEGIGDTNG